MDWRKTYEARTTTPELAVRAAIKSGNRIFLTGNCSIVKQLLAALVEYAPELADVEICHALTMGSTDYVSPAMEGHLRVNSLFIGGNVRQAINEGRADFTPVLLSEFPLMFTKGWLPLDVALIHVSEPDEHGYCSFGIETGLTKSAAESAKIIIAEVNPNMPRILGDSFIHVSKMDYIVPVDYVPEEMPMHKDGDSKEVMESIAGHIADLIPDGATMQLGIGSIPDAVLRQLTGKKDLGIHSELFSDGVVELVEKGVITCAQKTLHPGKIVCGFVLGTRNLYKWAHDNPFIEMRPTEYVNNPFIIAKNNKMVAINSAIEVDFTGQVCADSIGPRFYSGVGGQMDFIYGASLSEGGVPVIALPSITTRKNGERISRIVPMLKEGAGVTTTRNHVHYVCTEFGIVDLYGKSIRQRSKALISIAHPDFRKELEKKAHELNFI
jgi:4-hydroxybutyrate CoA-transferase